MATQGVPISKLPRITSPEGIDIPGVKSGRTGKISTDLLPTKAEVTNIDNYRKGYFSTDTELKAAYPSPKVGYYAYVGSTGTIWKQSGGTWIDSGELIPDDVDLSLYAKNEDLVQLGRDIPFYGIIPVKGYGYYRASDGAFVSDSTNDWTDLIRVGTGDVVTYTGTSGGYRIVTFDENKNRLGYLLASGSTANQEFRLLIADPKIAYIACSGRNENNSDFVNKMAVRLDRADFFNSPRNLTFYYTTDGTYTTTQTNDSSGFIPVSAGDIIQYQGTTGGAGIRLYDKDFNFLLNLLSSVTSTTPLIREITDENVSYILSCGRNSTNDSYQVPFSIKKIPYYNTKYSCYLRSANLRAEIISTNVVKITMGNSTRLYFPTTGDSRYSDLAIPDEYKQFVLSSSQMWIFNIYSRTFSLKTIASNETKLVYGDKVLLMQVDGSVNNGELLKYIKIENTLPDPIFDNSSRFDPYLRNAILTVEKVTSSTLRIVIFGASAQMYFQTSNGTRYSSILFPDEYKDFTIENSTMFIFNTQTLSFSTKKIADNKTNLSMGDKVLLFNIDGVIRTGCLKEQVTYSSTQGVITENKFYKKNGYTEYISHRGVFTDGITPENSIYSIRTAAQSGFHIVEFDVRRTSNNVLIIMHDESINRTMRNKSDYSEISEIINVVDMTFQELRENYVLESANEYMRIEIPSLEEMLIECRKQGIIPMIHRNGGDASQIAATAKSIVGDFFCYFDSSQSNMTDVRGISKECLIVQATGVGTLDSALSYLITLGGNCAVSMSDTTNLTEQQIMDCISNGVDVQISIHPISSNVQRLEQGATMMLTNSGYPNIEKSTMVDINRYSGYTGLTTTGVMNGNIKIDNGQTVRLSNIIPEIKLGGINIMLEFSGNIQLKTGRWTANLSHEGMKVSNINLLYVNEQNIDMLITATQNGVVINDLSIKIMFV
jgi:hypothetical protein